MKTFEVQLEQHKFIRIHRAHLISSAFIKRINKTKDWRDNVELFNDEEMSISESGQKELKDKFNL